MIQAFVRCIASRETVIVGVVVNVKGVVESKQICNRHVIHNKRGDI